MSSSYESAKAIFAEAIFKALKPYKERTEIAIGETIERFGVKNGLRDACEYALKAGGKRFRPAIVYMITESLHSKNDVTDAALAVEFFHTASLIADDLPCMDNDDFRRGVPTTHKVYGESVAILASFSLTAAAFEYIAANSKVRPDVCQLAIDIASKLNGVNGLLGGQYMDLFPSDITLEKLYEVIEKKTVTLFELSFVLGWLFGGGDLKLLPEIKSLAFHFGSAFQIIDDLDDMEKDKAAGRVINYALLFGKKEAVGAVKEHIAQFKKLLTLLKIKSESLELLSSGMDTITSAF